MGTRKRKNGVLQNRLYIGEIVLGRTRKVVNPQTRKPLIVANPESEWQIAPAPEMRIVSDNEWDAVQAMLGEVQSRRPDRARRPKHMLSGMVTCAMCGGAWTVCGPDRWGCSRRREGGTGACGNGRTVSTTIMEGRVLIGLQHHLLDPALVEIYVREYHLEHARKAKEIDRESDRLRRQHQEATARVDRLVLAVANGGEEFVEIRDLLTQARATRDRLAEDIAQLEQLPVVALHPTIIADYRGQVEKLNAALAENPAARIEAIPKLRALIDRVTIGPAEDGQRGVRIEVTGRLSQMLALATGKPVSSSMYVRVRTQ